MWVDHVTLHTTVLQVRMDSPDLLDSSGRKKTRRWKRLAQEKDGASSKNKRRKKDEEEEMLRASSGLGQVDQLLLTPLSCLPFFGHIFSSEAFR